MLGKLFINKMPNRVKGNFSKTLKYHRLARVYTRRGRTRMGMMAAIRKMLGPKGRARAHLRGDMRRSRMIKNFYNPYNKRGYAGYLQRKYRK